MSFSESSLYKRSVTRIAKKYSHKGSSILITGASGLIGSCLVDVLLEAGLNVYALDLNVERLQNRFGQEKDNLHYVLQNVCEPLTVGKKFDYIVHAASFADPKSYALFPVETILVNVIGAKNVLDYAKRTEGARVLITSTFEVYGKAQQESYCEEDYGLLDYNSLRSCYPESKRTAEVLLKSYCDEYGIDGLIVRFSSIYGPTMLKNDSKAHAQFLFKGINKENIVLKSQGNQKRTYTYVMDAVDALLFVLFNGKSGEAYNIANGESIITIAGLAGLIASICGVEIGYDSPDKLEQKGFSKPQDCILNTKKLTALGWTPSYSLSEGLEETVAIMKEEKRGQLKENKD